MVFLLEELRSLLDSAKTRSLTIPLEWGQIPGLYRYTEHGLQRYKDVEHAYASFSIEITGGESPALRNFKAEHTRG